ncbi:hypothetical protein GCM10007366_06800 [Mammaliicoccus vitulinus]|nr:hypothetical protein GCM10007366_06800 [Mammaliicoccus vitulinus]
MTYKEQSYYLKKVQYNNEEISTNYVYCASEKLKAFVTALYIHNIYNKSFIMLIYHRKSTL